MADTLRRAQLKPDAGAWEILFQATGPTVVSTIRACNVASISDKVSIRHVYAGESEADAQYVCEEVVVPPGLPYSMTEGVTMLEDDVIYVRALRGTTAFHLFGAQKN